MNLLSLRVILSILAGIVGISLLISTQFLTDRFYTQNSYISSKIVDIELNLNRVENELLKNTILLYYSYDYIDKDIKRIDKDIKELYKNPIFKDDTYKKTYKQLIEFKEEFNRYQNIIERFLILNGTIKNSAIYIQTLHLKIIQNSNFKSSDIKLITLLAQISTTIAMAKNSLDLTFIKKLNQYGDNLKDFIKDYNGSLKHMLISMYSHIRVFTRYFPLYLDTFNNSLNMHLKQKSSKILSIYQLEAKYDINKINYIIKVILALYLLSLIVVIYFIFKVQKDYDRLNRLHKDLKMSFLVDNLTKVKNRQAFREDIKEYKNPVLILINIDRFQHINDFYGVEIGDRILKIMARALSRFKIDGVEKKDTYRLGGDDFGILFDNSNLDKDIFKICRELYDYIEERNIRVDGIDFDVSITIGASSQKHKLFESADMALKYAKKSTRNHIAIFNKDIDNSQEISKNITMIKSIKRSISTDISKTIVTHYQPILNLKSNKIDHYEALARINAGGYDRILQPSEFLEVIKMAKLNGVLTTEILRQTLKKAQTSCAEFGINISESDILDKDEQREILNLLKEYKDSSSKRVVFEILECEDISDYDKMRDFIKRAKSFGAKFAIDDFGTGYSNFEKILKLDFDYLKIDASLIKRLDSDEDASLMVSTIVTFCKKAGIKTIAEFVYSEEILQRVKDMGIDYAQGYYIGKPSQKLKTTE